MSNLPAALKALSQGFTIFPVEPGEKTPHRLYPHRPKEDAPWTIKWSEVATSDINKVVEWWTWSPEANVGVAAKPSGILVVDCDMPKHEYQLKGTPYAYLHERWGPLVDGTDVLRAVCERYGGDWDALYNTYRVCTTRMGLHLYFWWPDLIEASQASIVKGILDIRCNGGDKGGYVLGAGSWTSAGSYVEENNLPLAIAPPWLVELCREKPRLAQPRDAAMFRQPGSASYGGLVSAVRFAQEGNRNAVCLWAARSMCEDGATEEEAMELLVPAAMEAGLYERDIRATIRSAYRLQQRKGGRGCIGESIQGPKSTPWRGERSARP